MPDRVEIFTISCPPATAPGSPVEILTAFDPGAAVKVTIVIPDGHAGITGIALAVAHQPVIPKNRREKAGEPYKFIEGNDETYPLELDGYPQTGAWSAFLFNEDAVNEHSWQLRFEVNEVVANTTVSPTVTELPLTASGEPEGLQPPTGETAPETAPETAVSSETGAGGGEPVAPSEPAPETPPVTVPEPVGTEAPAEAPPAEAPAPEAPEAPPVIEPVAVEGVESAVPAIETEGPPTVNATGGVRAPGGAKEKAKAKPKRKPPKPKGVKHAQRKPPKKPPHHPAAHARRTPGHTGGTKAPSRSHSAGPTHAVAHGGGHPAGGHTGTRAAAHPRTPPKPKPKPPARRAPAPAPKPPPRKTPAHKGHG
jgi:hypothetical protein